MLEATTILLVEPELNVRADWIALLWALCEILCEMAEVKTKTKSKRCTKSCVAFGCSNVASLESRTAGISFHA